MAHPSRRNFFIPVALVIMSVLTLMYGQISRPVFAQNQAGATGNLNVSTELNFLNANKISGAPSTGQPLTLTVTAGVPSYFYINDFGSHTIHKFHMIVTGASGQSISQLSNCPPGTTFTGLTTCTTGLNSRNFAIPLMDSTMYLGNVFPPGSSTQWLIIFANSGQVTISVSDVSYEIVGVTTIS